MTCTVSTAVCFGRPTEFISAELDKGKWSLVTQLSSLFRVVASQHVPHGHRIFQRIGKAAVRIQ